MHVAGNAFDRLSARGGGVGIGEGGLRCLKASWQGLVLLVWFFTFAYLMCWEIVINYAKFPLGPGLSWRKGCLKVMHLSKDL